MKTTVLLFAASLIAPMTTQAPSLQAQDLEQRIQMLEDRSALEALVDTFSVLADRKDVDRQVLLFTEDAVVESYADGLLLSSLEGRVQIGAAFSAFLAGFETVYHMNGQQIVEIDGDRATGTSYCLVVLVGDVDGTTVRQTMGVTYQDEYVRHDGAWLIARRTSNFAWQDRQPAGGAG